MELSYRLISRTACEAAVSPGGMYLYERDGHPIGRFIITLPKPGEAWLRREWFSNQPVNADQVSTATRLELDEVRRLGAKVVRRAVSAGDDERLQEFGFELVASWIVGSLTVDDFTGLDSSQLLRARRFSSSQWHNTRVRLAVQFVVESFLPPTIGQAGKPGTGQWGLIGAVTDPYCLHAFGPMDLMTAFSSGEVVVAGDPARPRGVMLLQEPRRGEKPIFKLRWLAASPSAAGALLNYTGRRLAAFPGSTLVFSLPQSLAYPVLEQLGSELHYRKLDVFQLSLSS